MFAIECIPAYMTCLIFGLRTVLVLHVDADLWLEDRHLVLTSLYFTSFCHVSFSLLYESVRGVYVEEAPLTFRQQCPLGQTGALVLTWQSTLTAGSRSLTWLHPGNRFCWRAKRCEGLTCYYARQYKYLERRWAPPSSPKPTERTYGSKTE